MTHHWGLVDLKRHPEITDMHSMETFLQEGGYTGAVLLPGEQNGTESPLLVISKKVLKTLDYQTEYFTPGHIGPEWGHDAEGFFDEDIFVGLEDYACWHLNDVSDYDLCNLCILVACFFV